MLIPILTGGGLRKEVRQSIEAGAYSVDELKQIEEFVMMRHLQLKKTYRMIVIIMVAICGLMVVLSLFSKAPLGDAFLFSMIVMVVVVVIILLLTKYFLIDKIYRQFQESVRIGY